MMLRLLKTVFEREGFKVLTAQDGEEAVQVYEQRKGEIALVLSDMVLPNMDGWKLYARLKASNPQARVIFISGNFDPKIAAKCKDRGVLGFIAKPFKLDDVIERVRSAIEPSRASDTPAVCSTPKSNKRHEN